MKHTLINADVLEGLQKLQDKSIHTVVTSPPYWAVRDYGIDGQLGLESNVDKYLQKMVEVFREVRRVLRDDGTLWLNIGDKYVTNSVGRSDIGGMIHSGKNPKSLKRSYRRDKAAVCPDQTGFVYDLPEKNLMMIPARLAIALQLDGWILRQDIIWHKPNPMPESVTDRPTNAHEHLFLFAKCPRYYYDAEAVREEGTIPAGTKAAKGSQKRANTPGVNSRPPEYAIYTGTRNLRSVWSIPTQPRPDAHFATFPDELARRCILAGTSEYGCCPHCGAAWTRETDSKFIPQGDVSIEKGVRGAGSQKPMDKSNSWDGFPRGKTVRTTAGWKPSCTCENNIPIPCTVLDPFGGSGTVADIARGHNRSSILIEINPDYIDLQKQRLRTNEQLNTGLCSIEVIKV